MENQSSICSRRRRSRWDVGDEGDDGLYPPDMQHPCEPIVKDQILHLSFVLGDYLVRNTKNGTDGERMDVNHLNGKFVLVSCFLLPMETFSAASYYCRALKAAIQNWYQDGVINVNLEIVLVPMITHKHNDGDVFNNFMSAFPEWCLTIPFSDFKARACACKSAGLTASCHPTAFVVDPSQRVLQTIKVLEYVDMYGSDSFPFTDDHFRRLDDLAEEAKRRLRGSSTPTLSLHQLLCCKPSDFLFSNATDSNSNNPACISVSDLTDTLVGLYLCYNGVFMDRLHQAFQHCRHLGLDLEIVVVYLPVIDDTNLFVDLINSRLQEEGISSWWLLPFNHNVSRTLWQLCDSAPDDQLIILGPRGSFWELNGVGMLGCLGNNAYPYAFHAIVEREFARLSQLNLECLLAHSKELLTCDGTRVPSNYIKAKNVLLYVGLSFDDPRCNGVVLEWYKKYAHICSGLQLLYVPLSTTKKRKRGNKILKKFFSRMPWLTCSLDHDGEAFVIDNLYLKGTYACDAYILFGQRGQILSIDAYNALVRQGVDAIPFRDNLHNDVVAGYAKLFPHIFDV